VRQFSLHNYDEHARGELLHKGAFDVNTYHRQLYLVTASL